MAIGISNMMGIETKPNFDRPYFSKSISEFWRRWHISLSTWFRDYVYIPLGGSRCTLMRWSINIVTVFLLSGLWHGGDATFLIWGALHGGYQVIERLLKRKGIKKDKVLYSFFSRVITFFLVGFAWMFFRANTLSDVRIILKRMFVMNESNLKFNILSMGLGMQDLIFLGGCLITWFAVEATLSKKELLAKIKSFALPIRWAIYLFFIFVSILFGIYGDLTEASYIYFQF